MAEGTVPGGPVSDETSEGFVPQPVSELPNVPGAVSTRPDVLAARAAAVASREGLAVEVDRLRSTARATFDLKARIRGIPDRAREDPVRAAAAAGVAAAGVAGFVSLIARSRRRKPYGVMPDDIEEAFSKLGKNGDRIRKAVEGSFAEYLREHGAQEPSRRRRIPPALVMFAAPVAGQVARAVIQRVMAPPPDLADRRDERPAS